MGKWRMVTDELVEAEHHRRAVLWEKLAQAGGPTKVPAGLLRELGIYGSQTGIWVDKARTGLLTSTSSGVTVSLLHTGTRYADDLFEEGVIYHYPHTKRPPSRDLAEVEATKAAGELRLPTFVITRSEGSPRLRDVRRGWVEGWTDAEGLFLISFGAAPAAAIQAVGDQRMPNSRWSQLAKDAGKKPLDAWVSSDSSSQ